MVNRIAVYRSRRSGVWLLHPMPGPYPQTHSRKYPTIGTMCTCGHLGPLHKSQTTEARARTDKEKTMGKQAPRLRYRGRCNGMHPSTGMRCPCGWFLEDLPVPMSEDERRARYAWRPKGDNLPPLPKTVDYVLDELSPFDEMLFYANEYIVGDWD